MEEMVTFLPSFLGQKRATYWKVF